jgi:glycosyltransferase involved in cell wall biosynthesis
MSQAPFFSIIIPTRDIHHYIVKETLPALAKQTYTHFELIILPHKNGTSDTTLTKQYSWLKILPTHTITKPGDKRDYAVENAKGDIISFIDDDVYPPETWLQKAANLFQERPDIVAAGGPGIIPEQTNIWEKIFDEVLKTSIGSGAYTYRFVKEQQRFVDDYPTMNLMIKKDIFLKLGGFNNQYWPGEDSKLSNALAYTEKKLILYHPDLYVYHHRRTDLLGYLRQHANYGHTRGRFVAQGDKNSTKLMYLVPTLFLLYFLSLIILHEVSSILLIHPNILLLSLIPITCYIGGLSYVFFYSLLNTKNILIASGAFITIVLTHFTYGIYFIIGFLKDLNIISKLHLYMRALPKVGTESRVK